MQQVDDDLLGLALKNLSVRALNALVRRRWDGAALVEEQATPSGRRVRVTVEEVRREPPRPAPQETNGRATFLDDSDIIPPAAGPGRKPGRCRGDIITLLDRRGRLRYGQIITGLADGHHENTAKENLKSLVAVGAVIKNPDGTYQLPESD